ncbi:hypothetical protein NN561_011138 [Cricetulus griseus]
MKRSRRRLSAASRRRPRRSHCHRLARRKWSCARPADFAGRARGARGGGRAAETLVCERATRLEPLGPPSRKWKEECCRFRVPVLRTLGDGYLSFCDDLILWWLTMAQRAVWLIRHEPGNPLGGTVKFSRRYPTVEKRAKVFNGKSYVPVPEDGPFLKALLFQLRLLDDDKDFVERRDSCSHINKSSIYGLLVGAAAVEFHSIFL